MFIIENYFKKQAAKPAFLLHKKYTGLKYNIKKILRIFICAVILAPLIGCSTNSHKVYFTFSEGLAAVSLNDKMGYIDKNGNGAIFIK